MRKTFFSNRFRRRNLVVIKFLYNVSWCFDFLNYYLFFVFVIEFISSLTFSSSFTKNHFVVDKFIVFNDNFIDDLFHFLLSYKFRQQTKFINSFLNKDKTLVERVSFYVFRDFVISILDIIKKNFNVQQMFVRTINRVFHDIFINMISCCKFVNFKFVVFELKSENFSIFFRDDVNE